MELTGVLISTTELRHSAMRQFYVETLGLMPRSDRPGFVNFDFGHSRLTIATHDAVEGAASDPARMMVNFRTTDIEAVVARCDPGRVIRWPQREHWGGLVATVADPDGNFVQFLEME
jgi:catechol 2,3-dioxygenase-like lactoylglutathione lyase family enzyme